MITLEKILNVFADYLAEDQTLEVMELKHGYYVVSWQSLTQHYEFSNFCPTLDELANVLTSYYAQNLKYKNYEQEMISDDEKMQRFMEAANQKKLKCYSV